MLGKNCLLEVSDDGLVDVLYGRVVAAPIPEVLEEKCQSIM